MPGWVQPIRFSALVLSHCNSEAPMSEFTRTLCLIGVVVCLCPCLICAFVELESARQRRRERNRSVRDAMRTVVSINRRSE